MAVVASLQRLLPALICFDSETDSVAMAPCTRHLAWVGSVKPRFLDGTRPDEEIPRIGAVD
jgi:hypothetical protein